MRALASLAFLATLATAPALAQPEVDPDWPCIQRKVPELTIGQMWSGPLPPEDAEPDPAAIELARRITPRRVADADVEEAVSAYATSLGDDERPERLAETFAAVLNRINSERSQVITGIARYSNRQIAMAERIAVRESAVAELQSVPDDQRDMDALEEAQDALKWEARIYRDRQQSLAYVCETPVLLEQRAFSIARIIQGMI